MIRGEPCPVCESEREYKTLQGARKGASKPCKACSNSLKLGGPGMSYTEDGEKLCNDCRERPQKHNSVCSECAVKRRKEYYRTKMRFDRYGTTEDWFTNRYEGSCEICGVEQDPHEICIDHCHTSGEVRGLLCKSCNSALGFFKDNITSLERAINYLRGVDERR